MILYNKLTIIVILASILYVKCYSSEIAENNISIENAYNLVEKALNKLDKSSITHIVRAGSNFINNEKVMILAAGENPLDNSEYTALYHFAVSASGRVYYLDNTEGSEWKPLELNGKLQKNSHIFQATNISAIQGMYTRAKSTERINSVLSLKHLTDRMFLFEFELFNNGVTDNISGIINVDLNNCAHYDLSTDKSGKNLLIFYFSNTAKIIRIEHTGTLKKKPDGLYQYHNDKIEISENAAFTLIRNLPAVLTSLNIYNIPYVLKCIEYNNKGELIIIARHTETANILAKFAVADDLSSIYRIDDDFKKTKLIFGKPTHNKY